MLLGKLQLQIWIGNYVQTTKTIALRNYNISNIEVLKDLYVH